MEETYNARSCLLVLGLFTRWRIFLSVGPVGRGRVVHISLQRHTFKHLRHHPNQYTTFVQIPHEEKTLYLHNVYPCFLSFFFLKLADKRYATYKTSLNHNPTMTIIYDHTALHDEPKDIIAIFTYHATSTSNTQHAKPPTLNRQHYFIQNSKKSPRRAKILDSEDS